MLAVFIYFFFFSSRRRHTRCSRDWSSDVCSSDLSPTIEVNSANASTMSGLHLAGSSGWYPWLKSSTLWSDIIVQPRSEEHTSELQSRLHLVCRLLLEKKKKNTLN